MSEYSVMQLLLHVTTDLVVNKQVHVTKQHDADTTDLND